MEKIKRVEIIQSLIKEALPRSYERDGQINLFNDEPVSNGSNPNPNAPSITPEQAHGQETIINAPQSPEQIESEYYQPGLFDSGKQMPLFPPADFSKEENRYDLGELKPLLSSYQQWKIDDIENIAITLLNKDKYRSRNQILKEIADLIRSKGIDTAIQEYLEKMPELLAKIPEPHRDQVSMPGIEPQIKFLPTREEFDEAIEIEKKKYDERKSKYLEEVEDKKRQLGRNPSYYEIENEDPDLYGRTSPHALKYEYISQNFYNEYIKRFKQKLEQISSNIEKIKTAEGGIELLKPNSNFIEFEQIKSLPALLDDIGLRIKWGVYNVVKTSVGQILFSKSVSKYDLSLSSRDMNSLKIFNQPQELWFKTPGLIEQFIEYVDAPKDSLNTERTTYFFDSAKNLTTIKYWAAKKYSELETYNNQLIETLNSLEKGMRFFKQLQKKYDQEISKKLIEIVRYNDIIFSNEKMLEKLKSAHEKIAKRIEETSKAMGSVSRYETIGVYGKMGVQNFGIGATLAAKIPFYQAIDSFVSLATDSIVPTIIEVQKNEIQPIKRNAANKLAEDFQKEILGIDSLPVFKANEILYVERPEIGSPELNKVADLWLDAAAKYNLGNGYATLIKYPNFIIKDQKTRQRIVSLMKHTLGASVVNFLSNGLSDVFLMWINQDEAIQKMTYTDRQNIESFILKRKQAAIKFALENIRKSNHITIPNWDMIEGKSGSEEKNQLFLDLYASEPLVAAFTEGAKAELTALNPDSRHKFDGFERAVSGYRAERKEDYSDKDMAEMLNRGIGGTLMSGHSAETCLSFIYSASIKGAIKAAKQVIADAIDAKRNISDSYGTNPFVGSILQDSGAEHRWSRHIVRLEDLYTHLNSISAGGSGLGTYAYSYGYTGSLIGIEKINELAELLSYLKMRKIGPSGERSEDRIKHIAVLMAIRNGLPEEYKDVEYESRADKMSIYEELSVNFYPEAEKVFTDMINSFNETAEKFNQEIDKAKPIFVEIAKFISALLTDNRAYSLLRARFNELGGVGPMFIVQKFDRALRFKEFKNFDIAGYAKYLINKTPDLISDKENLKLSSTIKDPASQIYNDIKATETVTSRRTVVENGVEQIKETKRIYHGSKPLFATMLCCKILNITDYPTIEKIYNTIYNSLRGNVSAEDIEKLFPYFIKSKENLESQISTALAFASFVHNEGNQLTNADIKKLATNSNVKDWVNEVNIVRLLYTTYAKIKAMGGLKEITTKYKVTIQRLLSTGMISRGFVKSTESFLRLVTSGERVNPSLPNFEQLRQLITKTSVEMAAIQDSGALEEYDKRTIPKDGKLFDLDGEVLNDKIRFRVLKTFDPYHFKVGIDTRCCQRLNGVGEAAAIDSYINPLAGVVLLEYKNKDGEWELAAQSYFHYVPEDNGIILDNVETTYAADRLESMFGLDMDKIYALWARKKTTDFGYKYFLCGKKYNKLTNSQFTDKSISSDPRRFAYEEKYSDFSPTNSLNLLKPKFSLPDEQSETPEASAKKKKNKVTQAGLFADMRNTVFRRLILGRLANMS